MNAETTFAAGRTDSVFVFLKKYVTLLVLMGLLLLFAVIAPNFATPNNFIILLRQVSFTAISAVGIAFVMISGGMDLSIGAQISLTNVLAAILMARMGCRRWRQLSLPWRSASCLARSTATPAFCSRCIHSSSPSAQ